MKQCSDDVFTAIITTIYSYIYCPPPSLPLFRNTALEGLFDKRQTPKPMKTGTTIAGVVFKASMKLF